VDFSKDNNSFSIQLFEKMKLITPKAISSEIISIIENAEKFVVLVSPYNDWRNWHTFKKALKKMLA
jgi:hypothetical protein